ncbi:MAG: hypothetical protein ABI995_10800 [Acidobacteriota bacterium]
MIPWVFVAFTGVMGGLIYLHFYMAHVCWRRVRGQVTEDIDPNYVRREDYFGQSFRTKLQTWRELPTVTLPDGSKTIQHGAEVIRLSPAIRRAGNLKSDDVLVIQGDFTSGPNSQLGREVHAEGNIDIGPSSQLQAIASDGNLTLGTDVAVTRWVDSWGDLHLSRGCVVHSRVTSRKSAFLELNVQAQSVFAAEITTAPDPSRKSAPPPASTQPRLQIPPPTGTDPAVLTNAGVDPKKLMPLGAACWIYRGSLRPLSAVHLTAQLVVRGECVIPPASLLEHDLKSSGNLFIGSASECRGNLVSEANLSVGPDVRFAGMIHADGEILLHHGARGESPNGPLAVDAGSWLNVEQGVTVRGKLSSGERVRVIPASVAQAWSEKHRPQEVNRK